LVLFIFVEFAVAVWCDYDRRLCVAVGCTHKTDQELFYNVKWFTAKKTQISNSNETSRTTDSRLKCRGWKFP
jgi:hypothetical protein